MNSLQVIIFILVITAISVVLFYFIRNKYTSKNKSLISQKILLEKLLSEIQLSMPSLQDDIKTEFPILSI